MGRTLDRIFERFPGLAVHAHRLLLALSLFGRQLHTSTDQRRNTYSRPIISAPVLAQMEGKSELQRQRHYSGFDFLKRHRSILPDFQWTGWKPNHYSKQVRHHGLPPNLVDLVIEDLLIPVQHTTGMLDLHSGAVVPSPYTGAGARRLQQERADTKAKALARSEQALCPEQEMLLNLLNSQHPRLIGTSVKANAEHAAHACLDIEGEAERLRELMLLRQVQYRPFIYYAPSRRKKTVRIFPVGISLLSLRKQVRLALYKGHLECDLRNAQLACAARAWHIAPLLDHLYSEGSVWPYLLNLVRGWHTLTDERAKGVLKETIYSICFGKPRRGVNYELGQRLSFEAASRLMHDPLVQSLFEARDAAMKRMDESSGAVDCFGLHYPVLSSGPKRRAKEIRSALAGTMQALELKLLMPVVKDAVREQSNKRPLYQLSAWQHDGFAVRARHSADRVERRLKRLVSEQATFLEIPTELEVKAL